MDTPERKGWPYTPHLIVFFSSTFIMVVELVAGRLIARHLGSSIYTWTSIIGVILAGMSAGNYIGGRLADRWRPESILGPLFLIASVVSLSVLPLNRLLPQSWFFDGMMWPTRTFLTVLAIFFFPAMCLGTISPAATKMAVERGHTMGQSIGSVYAWGAVGSIGGTFLTGFWLIAALGAKGVVLTVAFALAGAAALLGPLRWPAAIWAAILGCLLIFSQVYPVNTSTVQKAFEQLDLREEPDSLYALDSYYQFVKVRERTSKYDSSRLIRSLHLDYLTHGYVDLEDPSHFEYHYLRLYRDVAQRVLQGHKTISAFFIGGGSYTFPRWVLHEWPGSRLEVAEIDPMVVEANYEALGLPRDTPIRTYSADARNVVDYLPADARYDLVVGDAFNDLTVPFHLTTLEFNEKIARRLTPDGVYMVNVIDDWEFARMLGAYVLTLQKTFKHVYVFCTESGGVKEGRDTFVVAALMKPIQVEDWRPGHDTSFSGSVLTEEQSAELFRKCRGRILTDDDAPVENLLEPVARKRN